VVILGSTSAVDRVSAFLTEMADRLNTGSDNVVTLPMSRYDIADYLAIAVESVSRALTKLRGRGIVTFDGPRRLRSGNQHRANIGSVNDRDQ
jgi:CRP-like cAMP-binding protein